MILMFETSAKAKIWADLGQTQFCGCFAAAELPKATGRI
jgi:hypothetical protein